MHAKSLPLRRKSEWHMDRTCQKSWISFVVYFECIQMRTVSFKRVSIWKPWKVEIWSNCCSSCLLGFANPRRWEHLIDCSSKLPLLLLKDSRPGKCHCAGWWIGFATLQYSFSAEYSYLACTVQGSKSLCTKRLFSSSGDSQYNCFAFRVSGWSCQQS